MKPTNILIDCSHIQAGRYGGIYKYAMELIKGFLTYTDYHITALVWDDKSEEIEQYVGLPFDRIVMGDKERTFMRHHVAVRRMLGWPFFDRLKAHDIDLVITPFTQVKSIIFPKTCTQIGVVHDIHDVTRSKQTQPAVKHFFWDMKTRWALKSMDVLVSISQDTRDSLLRYVHRDSTVIKNSIPCLENTEQTTDTLDLPEHYILDVNSWARYKNAEGLIRAFALIKEQIPHKLYLKGSAPRNPVEHDIYRSLVKELKLEERVILDGDYMTEEALNTLYKHADLFVSPSFMEGFGFTPIEAALHKVPTIASDISTIREVTMQQLPLFNPHSDRAIADCILKTLTHRPSPDRLQEIADLYREEYSLKKQIARFVLLIDALQ